MRRNKFVLFGVFLIVSSFLFLPSVFSADETITISTYYPAPYGIYKELRAQRVAIGENYINNVQYCWAPNVCTNQIDADADLVVEGNVRIGTTTAPSLSKLDVHSGSSAAHLTISGMDTIVSNPPNENYAVIGLHDDTVDGNNAWSIAHKMRIGLPSAHALHFDYWPTPATRFSAMSLSANGNVGIGNWFEGNAPQAKLDVAGEVKIGNTALGCNVNTAGALRYNGEIQYCDGTVWKTALQPNFSNLCYSIQFRCGTMAAGAGAPGAEGPVVSGSFNNWTNWAEAAGFLNFKSCCACSSRGASMRMRIYPCS